MLPLVAADLTSDRRHFNLCIGAFGLCSAAGATLSTAVGGWISDNAGHVPAFLTLAWISTEPSPPNGGRVKRF